MEDLSHVTNAQLVQELSARLLLPAEQPYSLKEQVAETLHRVKMLQLEDRFAHPIQPSPSH